MSSLDMYIMRKSIL